LAALAAEAAASGAEAGAEAASAAEAATGAGAAAGAEGEGSAAMADHKSRPLRARRRERRFMAAGCCADWAFVAVQRVRHTSRGFLGKKDEEAESGSEN